MPRLHHIFLFISLILLSACLKKEKSLNEEAIFSQNYEVPIWFEQPSEYKTSWFYFFNFHILNYQLGRTEQDFEIVYAVWGFGDYSKVFKQKDDTFTIRANTLVQEEIELIVALKKDGVISAPFYYKIEVE